MTIQSLHAHYDICIIGGGINGVGIARDAAGRGLTVLLCEQHDLASATSSASSKLIHGGLRYLEHYEFRLVHEALSERETLLTIAPHIVEPLRFVLPHEPHLRPAWMIRCGLFLYDHLAKRSAQLPSSSSIKLCPENNYGYALKRHYKKGFIYSDCQVDDARLVIVNAISAKQHGADILTHHKVVHISHDTKKWALTLQHKHHRDKTISASILINAAGPWVSNIENLYQPHVNKLRLVKGSHIVVPKFYPGNHAYLLQHKDNRIVFITPYREHFAMIGTTDIDFQGDPSAARITDEEKTYLLDLINTYVDKPLTHADIINTWSGVRPLYNDSSRSASSVTRDYVFDISGGDHKQPPLLSIYGGKITTYRRLAEHALDKLSPFTNKTKAWTATEKLPGATIRSIEEFAQTLRQHYPWVSESLALRYTRAYGDLAHRFLTEHIEQMGQAFGHGLFAREVDYLITQEWASSADDILWRRTKLGLLFNDSQTEKLAQYIQY